MYIPWNRLRRPLLRPQIFFRLRRAKNITRSHGMYVNWIRLRRAKNITRSQAVYVNWNRLRRPLLRPQIFFRLRRAKNIMHALKKCIFH